MRQWRSNAPVTMMKQPVLPGLEMKNDEFDGIHALKTDRVHDQVWNLRKGKSTQLNIWGVGQCHLDGLSFVAKRLRDEGFSNIVWCNMREEPLIYLNGTACAPRVEGRLNENVDYLLSIDGYELDAMEARLVSDCFDASERSAAGLPLWREVGGVNTQAACKVERGPRSTSVRGAYEYVNAQPGVAPVRYVRVPIADETAPEEKDFDQLCAELQPVASAGGMGQATALVFNCHMGRGRTTTGMVVASIILRATSGWAPPDDAPSDALPSPHAAGRNLARGEFTGVLELVKQLDAVGAAAGLPGAPELGVRAKALADLCCDECDEVTNLVNAPAKCLEKAAAAEAREQEGGAAASPQAGLAESGASAAFWRHRGVAYLERYAYLLLFAGYAHLAAAREDGFTRTFSDWMRGQWALKRTIKGLALA